MNATWIQEAVAAGQCFYFNTAATGIAGAVAGTSSAPMIWNPSDSNRNLHIIRISYGSISGTVILGHIAYAYKLGCGAQIGTAQPIVSYTAAAALNAQVGAGAVSRMNFAPATASLTGAPTYMMPNGLSSGGALAAGPLYKLVDEVNGNIIIPPGVAFFPYVSNAALALTAAVSVLAWEEKIQPTGI